VLMVLFALPALLLLCDRPICATTAGMRKIHKKEKAQAGRINAGII